MPPRWAVKQPPAGILHPQNCDCRGGLTAATAWRERTLLGHHYSAAAATGRRNVDRERDDEPGDRPEGPHPAEPAVHHGIPEQRGGQEDEAENGPERPAEHAAEPGREEPQEEDHQPRRNQGEQREEARHTPPLTRMPEDGCSGSAGTGSAGRTCS